MPEGIAPTPRQGCASPGGKKTPPALDPATELKLAPSPRGQTTQSVDASVRGHETTASYERVHNHTGCKRIGNPTPVMPSILGHRAVVNHGKEGWGSENPMPEFSGLRLRLWEQILLSLARSQARVPPGGQACSSVLAPVTRQSADRTRSPVPVETEDRTGRVRRPASPTGAVRVPAGCAAAMSPHPDGRGSRGSPRRR